MSRPRPLDHATVLAWCAAHEPFTLNELGHVVATFDVGYDMAVAVLSATSTLVARLDHHPVVTVGFHGFTVELWTHDQRGVTTLDLELAEGILDATGAVS